MRLVLAILLFASLSVCAQTITLTYENADQYPWYLKDGSGIDLILLKMVDHTLPEVAFEYKQTPWKRCLHNIKNNATEGCFSASFKEKRLELGYYPGTHKGEKVDTSMRIHSSSYSLYVLKNSNISVTGKLSISGLDGRVAAPLGYSIGDDLKKKGYKVDEGGILSIHNFEKLLMGRVQALAALSLNGNNILKKNKEYSNIIRVIHPPLIDKPYYLMFSKDFINSNVKLAEKIWATIAQVRESQEYKDKAIEFLSK